MLTWTDLTNLQLFPHANPNHQPHDPDHEVSPSNWRQPGSPYQGIWGDGVGTGPTGLAGRGSTRGWAASAQPCRNAPIGAASQPSPVGIAPLRGWLPSSFLLQNCQLRLPVSPSHDMSRHTWSASSQSHCTDKPPVTQQQQTDETGDCRIIGNSTMDFHFVRIRSRAQKECKQDAVPNPTETRAQGRSRSDEMEFSLANRNEFVPSGVLDVFRVPPMPKGKLESHCGWLTHSNLGGFFLSLPHGINPVTASARWECNL